MVMAQCLKKCIRMFIRDSSVQKQQDVRARLVVTPLCRENVRVMA